MFDPALPANRRWLSSYQSVLSRDFGAKPQTLSAGETSREREAGKARTFPRLLRRRD